MFYDPAISSLIDRDLAVATRTVRGGSVFGIWPLDRYRRLELFGGVLQYHEEFNDPTLQAISQDYQQTQFGRELFRSGTTSRLASTSFRRRRCSASSGRSRATRCASPTRSRRTSAIRSDGRPATSMLATTCALAAAGLLALRAKAFKSWGDAPDFIYFGGNSEMRGYDYLQFIGSEAGFLNAELRFPFIEAMLTPVGVLGGIRGVLFANMGGARFEGQPYKWFSNNAELYTPVVNYNISPFGSATPVFGTPQRVDGFRLVDARASYGIGLETFALGFPIHFDWAWRTLFNKPWEDLLFAASGGSSAFRKAQFAMWIGYDF